MTTYSDQRPPSQNTLMDSSLHLLLGPWSTPRLPTPHAYFLNIFLHQSLTFRNALSGMSLLRRLFSLTGGPAADPDWFPAVDEFPFPFLFETLFMASVLLASLLLRPLSIIGLRGVPRRTVGP